MREAHFLHQKRGPEPVLAPPIDAPRAASWLPGAEALLVAAADGKVCVVEPAFGTRALFTLAPEPVHLATAVGQAAVITRDGHLEVWDLEKRERRWEAATGLITNQGVRWWRDGVAVIGEDLEARRVVVFDRDGNARMRARAPAASALGVDDRGALLMGRCTEVGLSVVPLGKPMPLATTTAHRLRFGPGARLVGVLRTGATVWDTPASAPRTVRLDDTVNAAISRDGTALALGTRQGGLALAALADDRRQAPPRVDAHGAPIVVVTFSAKGRWLATVADTCRIWAW